MNAISVPINPRDQSPLGLLQEPAGYVDGDNLFEYVGGNPVNRLDPLGLAAVGAPVVMPSPVSRTGPIWEPSPVAKPAIPGNGGATGGTAEAGIIAGIVSQTTGWQLQVAKQIQAAGLCPESQQDAWQFFQDGVKAGNDYASQLAGSWWPIWGSKPVAPGNDFATSSGAATEKIRAKIAELQARDQKNGCAGCSNDAWDRCVSACKGWQTRRNKMCEGSAGTPQEYMECLRHVQWLRDRCIEECGAKHRGR